MRRIVFCVALVVVLAGVSVQAQKKSAQPRLGAPIVMTTNIVIQDDNGGGYLFVDLMSGEYKGNLCEYGYEFSGVGEVNVDGCSVAFSAIQKGHRVFASANMCEHDAKCAVEVFARADVGFDIEPMLGYWKDSDMNGNSMECGSVIIGK
jgi:hypothetical protein